MHVKIYMIFGEKRMDSVLNKMNTIIGFHLSGISLLDNSLVLSVH
jgi:hypothetical protein